MFVGLYKGIGCNHQLLFISYSLNILKSYTIMPLTAHDISSQDVHKSINSLINGMVNIRDETGEFLLKLDDGRIIDTKGWQGWEWTHGVGLYGVWKYYTLTGSDEALKVIEEWFVKRFEEGGTTKNINTMAAMLTLALLYEKTGNQTYLPWLESWADWAMYELPRTKYGGMSHRTYNAINSQELWDDTLMMSTFPLAKIGMVLDRPKYVEEAKRQFLLHIKYLFDTKTGLFYHGWTFADGGHNFANALWARGNSWLTIVIPEMLELLNLPTNDPFRIHLIATFEAQCSGLLRYQEESGLWRTLIDQPLSEGSYVESSATAGFAYGMLKGLRMRYIQGEEYREAAFKAIRGTLGKVSELGELDDTSFGTGMGHDLQHYKDIPITSMPYGQAMAIMALGEFLRVYI
ncbi:putative unsaturated rhamnogalacturonyl hydrolase yesR [Amylocarpus encephaloides]|uniref:Unsaturated rhamnogalacturonyl hydrolase yesR n=1 Tax=Amylocarpus encephaloides TaxID=45428 RepID=A0A9P7YRM5_9HELO|nr:putative unsaturated rhamnogalacturonyl hydrolase yesR [Amylocarpus encephaloides]